MTPVIPKNISYSVLRSHFNTYSRTLFEHFKKFAPILTSNSKIITHNNLYVCPLCTLNYFSEQSDGIEGNAEFSLDHVPPESVGGKFKVLTCKKCNNKSGEYEAELLRLVNFGSIPDRKSKSILPKMKVANKDTGEEFEAIIQINKGKSNITFNEEAKKFNENLIKFLGELHLGKIKTLRLSVPSPDLEKIERALLKSAYLACFVWWGYDFVYSDNGELIRKTINGQIRYPTRVPTIWVEEKTMELPKGVGIITKDGEKISFVVNLEIRSKTQTFMASILIPNPTERGWQKLAELNKYVESKTLTEFQCTTIPTSVRNNGYNLGWNQII